MSEHQKQTAFLKQCHVYHDTAASRKLAESLAQLERDERTLRRAVWLVARLAVLAVVGIGYAALLMDNYPDGTSGSVAHFIVKGCFGLGLGSLICLLSFLGLGMVYRMNLDQRREECRELVARLLESRLGQPVTTAWRDSQVSSGGVEGQTEVRLRTET